MERRADHDPGRCYNARHGSPASEFGGWHDLPPHCARAPHFRYPQGPPRACSLALSAVAEAVEPPAVILSGENRATALRLAQARKRFDERAWPESIEELQAILNTAGNDLVSLTPTHSVQARRLCQLQLASLPPDAVCAPIASGTKPRLEKSCKRPRPGMTSLGCVRWWTRRSAPARRRRPSTSSVISPSSAASSMKPRSGGVCCRLCPTRAATRRRSDSH